MLAECPALPEKAGELYHVISMQWWNNWQAYSNFTTHQLPQDPEMTHPDEEMSVSNTIDQIQDDQENIELNKDKVHHQHPGEINNKE